MKKEVKNRIQKTLLQVVEALVQRNYMTLENITGGIRLKAEHLEAGVNEYGKVLSYPPYHAYNKLDVIQIQGRTPPSFSVRFRLYTEEEGQSDLELQATLIDDNSASGLMRVEIDGILVP